MGQWGSRQACVSLEGFCEDILLSPSGAGREGLSAVPLSACGEMGAFVTCSFSPQHVCRLLVTSAGLLQ